MGDIWEAFFRWGENLYRLCARILHSTVLSMEITVREKIVYYLKSVSPEKRTYDLIKGDLKLKRKELKASLNELLDEGIILAIPIKRTGRWEWFYYTNSVIKESIEERLEQIFEELAIPPYIDIKVNRGFKVIIIGEYGKKPGLSIIDYNEIPPLIFRDNMYGGMSDEIIYYKSKSRYRCKKGGKEIWYNLHGRRINIINIK